ncbi:hypothetical protein H6B10_16920, partial [Gemmiger formicilis]|nr:hypothetical protein [Gemmiger formicilis]
VLLANRTPAKAQALAEELGCACGTNEQVASICDFIFLGIIRMMGYPLPAICRIWCMERPAAIETRTKGRLSARD